MGPETNTVCLRAALGFGAACRALEGGSRGFLGQQQTCPPSLRSEAQPVPRVLSVLTACPHSPLPPGPHLAHPPLALLGGGACFAHHCPLPAIPLPLGSQTLWDKPRAAAGAAVHFPEAQVNQNGRHLSGGKGEIRCQGVGPWLVFAPVFKVVLFFS